MIPVASQSRRSSASSSLIIGGTSGRPLSPSPPDGSRRAMIDYDRARRCPAGEGRGEGDSSSTAVRHSLQPAGPRVSTYPPHPALSRRNLSGSAERYTGQTRSVPGERGRVLSDVLKQPDDAYFGDKLQSNPKSKG